MSVSQLSEICKSEEADPEVRTKILEIVPEETRRALQAQCAAREDHIKERRGEKQEALSSEGRPYTQEDLAAYQKAKTKLGLGDWIRSREIASFFFKHGFALPDQDNSEVLNDALDYQDVKLKIVQQEGYDAHDYVPLARRNIYISRAGGHPGPAGQSIPAREGSPLSSLPSVRLSVFQLRHSCTEFRTRVQIPQSRSAEFHTPPVPHTKKNSPSVSYYVQVVGTRSGIRLALIAVVRAACSSSDPASVRPSIYSQETRAPLFIGLIVSKSGLFPGRLSA
jgi:hypothetical protein